MSPRTAEQNESIREERRRQILDAALVVFSQQGFDRANVSDVAAQAGVSQGTIYWYFDSKEALMQQLLVEAFDVVSEPFQAILKNTDLSPLERLLQGFGAGAAAFRGKEEKFRLLINLWAQPNLFASTDAAAEPDDQFLDRVYREQLFEPISRLIQEAMDAGEIAPGDVRALTIAFSALGDGLMLYSLTIPESQLTDEQMEEVLLRLLQPEKEVDSEQ